MLINPTAKDILIVIDVQHDFLPGGALAVPDGDAVIAPIMALAEAFDHVILTQDWHPREHISFASRHGKNPFETIGLDSGEQVLWPDHCIQGTHGARIADSLDIPKAQLIIRKGHHPAIDSYSAFMEADRRTPTGLAGYLARARAQAGFLRGPRHRLLRRLDGARRLWGGIRDVCDRGRLPGDRYGRVAGAGVGGHGGSGGQAGDEQRHCLTRACFPA